LPAGNPIGDRRSGARDDGGACDAAQESRHRDQ
jgi:hypothetical protein